MAAKVLSTIVGVVSVGFGIWHFTVPAVWRWYDYIHKDAPELVLAVRAINVFFSLSLVLFGVLSLIFTFSPKSSVFAFNVMMAICSILWLTRVVMQVIYPQGSVNLWLQYGMLAAFIITAVCCLLALILPKAF